MNLSYEVLSEPVELQAGHFCCLTIENTIEFRRIVEDLLDEKSRLMFFDENQQLDNKYIEVIDDIYRIDLNDKRIISKVMKNLETRMNDETMFVETLNLIEKINEFTSMLIFESDLPLEFDEEFNKQTFFKAIGIRVRDDSASFLEHILEYLSLLLKFANIKIFAFINLQLYLDENELTELINFAVQEELIIVDIERVKINLSLNNRLVDILIDSDLCRVL